MRYRATMEEYYQQKDEEIEANRIAIAKAIRFTKAVKVAIEGKSFMAIAKMGEAVFAACGFIENIWFLNKGGAAAGEYFG